MKSRTVKTLAIMIAIAMVVSPVSAAIAPTPVEARGSLPSRNDLVPTGSTSTDKFAVEEATSLEQYVVNKDGTLGYIVLFEGDSLVKVSGGAQGVDVNTIASQNYLASLAEKRSSILSQAEKEIGRQIEVKYVYDVILNGVSVNLTPEEADALSALPGIKKVLKDTIHVLDTDAGPAWLGAPEIWDGTAVPDEMGTQGEGVLVGILDTGINFDHPSFSDEPADEFVYTWEGDYLGVCAPDGDPDYADACNDKVVGAYSYTADAPSDFVTPEDSEGHGSHTASTVAGNTVDLEFYGTPVTISGMAPHAQIISYDVCYPTPSGGQCAGDDSVAAVQQAIEDGVDVINYSISGGEDPYNDPVELAFLEATDAGIVVSTSAGNEGPAAETVAHRSPWLLSTAASSHNRKFTSIVDFSNPSYQGIATLAGEHPFTEDLSNKPVKFSGEDSGNDLGCDAYPEDFFAGSIALIKRGTCTFSVKVLNAEDAGAVGVLIYTDDRAPGPMSVSGTHIPAVMLDIPGTVGDEIAAWVAETTDETVSISAYGRYVDDDYGDIMADFSSRGPNTTFDVLKPDVSAPGLEILAAVADGTIEPDEEAEFDLYQGTSMASPHDAGAAALLKALHPDWTPAEIKSALMLTGYDGLLKEDKTTDADPFDIGAGRIQLELAGLTGLVMDETIDNYEAADPALGGDPRSLNLASLYHSECVGECSWTRTFTSVAGVSATYTVSAPDWITVEPATFTIAPGATQEITITADVADLPTDEWLFGNVEFNTESFHPGGDPVILLQQDFTDATFPPTDWAVYNVDGAGSTWARDTTRFYSTPAAAKHAYNCSAGQEGWLVTPQIAIPSSGFTTLSFFENGDYTSDIVYHGILVSTGSAVPADGDFVEVAALSAPPEDAWTANPTLIDLSTYAEQSVYVAFKYTGNCADSWWIDDVMVSNVAAGAPISDVAIPVAVLPTTGNLPDMTKFDSHRDADSGTLVDLKAVEITDLTVDTYGFVKGVKNEIQLAQDPTNGDPYDNLDKVWYTVVPMDAGAARLVAEITATTAVDLDMFWGFDVNEDGLPSADEEYGYSATATAFEYLSEWGFPVPFYDVWILVQNWQGSGAPLDDITLSIGNVPYAPADPSTMTVLGPTSNPAGEPFTLDILWHDIDTEAGDRLYGLIDVYADAEYETEIGLTQIDVKRGVDDVVKTADVETATVGDVITYSIEITNFATDPTEYALNDVLPEGVTYVPDSATGGPVYDSATNAITWTGTIEPAHYAYDWTTSADDPACTLEVMPDGNPDAYLDWKTTTYGFSTNSSISGDSFWYSTFATYPAFNYYGVDYTGMHFTDDGYAGFAFEDVDYINQEIPDPTDPNNVLAAFWDDLVVQYDAATNKGVTLVGDGASFATIEYDDVYRWSGSTSVTMDVEIGYFLQPDDAPGMYEIVFAFDNIQPGFLSSASATIGVENADGTVGTLVSYNDPALAIENGSAICFDYVLVPPVHTITFQVVVDEDAEHGWIVNEAIHDTDSDFTVEESAVAKFAVDIPPVAVDDSYSAFEDTTLTVAAPGVLANDTDAEDDPLTASLVDDVEHGTLTLKSDGSFVYIPDPDYYGEDTFTYVANDGFADSDPATVTITISNVNDSPAAVDDYYETDQDTTLNVPAPGVLENDVDPDPTDGILADLKTGPLHGSLILNEDGSFTYVPQAGFFGTDSFVYYMIATPNSNGTTSAFVDEALVTIVVKPAHTLYLPIILK
ncbi:MAG: hypothetical protein canaca05_06980 [Anaerolineaceae bacterium]